MSLTDTMGSLAVATKGQWMTGVSTDIGTSFVRPSGRPGDILHAKATLVGMGSSSLMGRQHFVNSWNPSRKITCLCSCWIFESCGRLGSLWTYVLIEHLNTDAPHLITDHTKYVGKSYDHEVFFQLNPLIETCWRMSPTEKCQILRRWHFAGGRRYRLELRTTIILDISLWEWFNESKALELVTNTSTAYAA